MIKISDRHIVHKPARQSMMAVPCRGRGADQDLQDRPMRLAIARRGPRSEAHFLEDRRHMGSCDDLR